LSDYTGDFPSSLHVLNTDEIIRKASMFEVAVDENLREVPDLPPWLINDNYKKDLFEGLITTNQYKEA
jgi:hypothetical protein